MRVLRGRLADDSSSRVVIEIGREGPSVDLITIGEGGVIDLVHHPLTWFEFGRDGVKVLLSFDSQFKPLAGKGAEPYPPLDALRKMMRGCFGAPPPGYRGGALEAIIDALPSGDAHLFTPDGEFVGRFASIEDARLIGSALGVRGAAVFDGPAGVLALPGEVRKAVGAALGPNRSWQAERITNRQAKEIYEMATKARKKAAAAVSKTTKGKKATRSRTDGPVAQARAIFDKMKNATGSEILAACEKAGLNKGTANTQLAKWRKENGISVRRGGDRKSAKAAKKPAAKKKAAPKKAAKPKKVEQPSTDSSVSDYPAGLQ